MENFTVPSINFSMNITSIAPIDMNPYYRYEYTGLATIVTNILIFAVITTDRGLRERLPLYAVLAIGDVLNGCYFGYANFKRLQQMVDGTYLTPTSKWDCAKKLYSFFQLTGTQFPALIALLISIERVIAVQKPVWFHVRYVGKHRIVAVTCSLLFLALSLTIHYVTTYPLTNPSIPPAGTSQYCALTYSSDINYNRAHQAFITVTRIIAFALSAFAFIQASRKSRQVVAMRGEALQVAPILAVSILSLFLITIPQVGLLLTNNFASVPALSYLVHWILLMTCVNSLTNIFIYILFTRDFRRRVINLVTFNELSSTNSTVEPVSTKHAASRSVGIGNRRPPPVIIVS